MQPDCVSLTVSAGGAQCAGASPSLTHTNAFRNVPLGLTTIVCAFTGEWCWRSQDGFDDISITGITGLSPWKRIWPEIVPPVERSTWASGKAAGVSAWGFAPPP